ncbi:Aaa Atpase Bsc1 [Pandoravirus kuranda]|uniref:Aaa Atpase Bsc1 n=1 Tax=Pandoravirus kuranda TaxID=3019033 RepID=A0AA95EE69_9VIRU|nr:Aaa Atpase Bsc1 [Pandoravirus kuranda]
MATGNNNNKNTTERDVIGCGGEGGDSSPMAPIDYLITGKAPAASPATSIARDGSAIVLRCGSSTATDVGRYAAHLLLGDAQGATATGWSTPRDELRLEAVGPSRDANDKRVTVFQPDAGLWRFVDEHGRRFALDVMVNAAKPVASECDPVLYWEAVLTYHGRIGTRHTGVAGGAHGEGGGDDDQSDSHAAMEAFLAAAHKHAEPKVLDRITIRRWTGTHWSRHARPSKRPLDTLFLPANALKDVMDDMRGFLDGEADYARFGRPYKRVYLLSGAPGLGKSSLALALAGHFDLDLYVYAVDDESTDQGLGAAVSAADAPCVLLIEDVDMAGGPKSHLTLSGLTNVLDGAQTRHGVAVFLTTNHPDRLDAALVRSGRVDKWLRFDAATADQIVAMVRHYFSAQFGPSGDHRAPEDGGSGIAKDSPGDVLMTAAKARIQRLERVATSLAARRVSAAALSEFLFDHRRSEDIVADLKANIKTIGRRTSATNLGGASGSVDGGRHDADVSSMYC